MFGVVVEVVLSFRLWFFLQIFLFLFFDIVSERHEGVGIGVFCDRFLCRIHKKPVDRDQMCLHPSHL